MLIFTKQKYSVFHAWILTSPTIFVSIRQERSRLSCYQLFTLIFLGWSTKKKFVSSCRHWFDEIRDWVSSNFRGRVFTRFWLKCHLGNKTLRNSHRYRAINCKWNAQTLCHRAPICLGKARNCFLIREIVTVFAYMSFIIIRYKRTYIASEVLDMKNA